jgi:hypothetical protein
MVSRSSVEWWAGERRDHQHRRLGLDPLQRGQVVGEALEAHQPAERLLGGHLLVDRDLVAVDLDRADVELRLLVVLGQAVHQLEPGRDAVRHRRVGERRERVVVELGRGAGEFGERAHQRALRFIPLVEHHGWGFLS